MNFGGTAALVPSEMLGCGNYDAPITEALTVGEPAALRTRGTPPPRSCQVVNHLVPGLAVQSGGGSTQRPLPRPPCRINAVHWQPSSRCQRSPNALSRRDPNPRPCTSRQRDEVHVLASRRRRARILPFSRTPRFHQLSVTATRLGFLSWVSGTGTCHIIASSKSSGELPKFTQVPYWNYSQISANIVQKPDLRRCRRAEQAYFSLRLPPQSIVFHFFLIPCPTQQSHRQFD